MTLCRLKAVKIGCGNLEKSKSWLAWSYTKKFKRSGWAFWSWITKYEISKSDQIWIRIKAITSFSKRILWWHHTWACSPNGLLRRGTTWQSPDYPCQRYSDLMCRYSLLSRFTKNDDRNPRRSTYCGCCSKSAVIKKIACFPIPPSLGKLCSHHTNMDVWWMEPRVACFNGLQLLIAPVVKYCPFDTGR